MSADTLESTEHVEAAEQAGLRYTTDSVRGISRELVGDEFIYVAANGIPVTSERKLRRIRALAIPPPWTDVWICPHASGHLQVTARDAKGHASNTDTTRSIARSGTRRSSAGWSISAKCSRRRVSVSKSIFGCADSPVRKSWRRSSGYWSRH